MSVKISNPHVSVKQTGLRTTREPDNLEFFFNDITNSKVDIIQSMKKDISQFMSLPEVFYTQTATQKINNRGKGKDKDKKKVRSTRKKPKRNTTSKK
tara:strand:+ start:1641 stop:1931 length:291 start_codon:yes stop_codon:yes gene_type:complete